MLLLMYNMHPGCIRTRAALLCVRNVCWQMYSWACCNQSSLYRTSSRTRPEQQDRRNHEVACDRACGSASREERINKFGICDLLCITTFRLADFCSHMVVTQEHPCLTTCPGLAAPQPDACLAEMFLGDAYPKQSAILLFVLIVPSSSGQV